MSELQIGVLIIGIGIVALVYSFNVYQEWRFRKKTRQAFFTAHEDALLNIPKNNVRDDVEQGQVALTEELAGADALPRLGPRKAMQIAAERLSAKAVTETHGVKEDSWGSDHTDNPSTLVMNPTDHQALVYAMLDPSLDFIAEINFSGPYKLTVMPQFNTNKRIQLIGRTERGLWTPVEVLSGTPYKQINVSMQMVDRDGAITVQELNHFCQQASEFAEHCRATISFPQRQQKLIAARELDCFCADVDVLICISIELKSPVVGTQLRSFVEAAGLHLEPDGAFHYLSESGNILYTLMSDNDIPFNYHTLLDNTFSVLTLLFDVPRVAGGVKVFDRMIQFAHQLTSEFEAQLMDDNRKPLTDAGLQRIRAQLQRIYNNMDDRGIAPGSVAALRLFS